MGGGMNFLREVKLDSRASEIGDFVMLHPDTVTMPLQRLHPDAGRIGKVVAIKNGRMAVRFSAEAPLCMLPVCAFYPVPRFMVEPIADQYRLSARGESIARGLGWPITRGVCDGYQ